MDGPILDRIVEVKSAHDAWDLLRKECQGTSKALSMRSQALKQGFGMLQMEDNKGIQDYYSRVITTLNQIWGLSHKLREAKVVSKILRSLAPKFDFVVVTIEESKEISKLTLDEPSSSLQAHEVRVNQALVKNGEKALHVKGESTSTTFSKGGGSKNPWGDGRGPGR